MGHQVSIDGSGKVKNHKYGFRWGFRNSVSLVLLLAPVGWSYDWLEFCGDGTHTCVNKSETTLNIDNVKGLKKIFSIPLANPGDAQPAFLSGVNTVKGFKDVLFVLTSQGEIIAMDAYTGATVWSKKFGGKSYLVTGPSIDPGREFVYTYGLDGKVHKLKVGDGTEILDGGWPELSTAVQGMRGYTLTIATAKNGTSYLYSNVTFYGGSPGSVTAINLATGSQHVFNGTCTFYDGHFGLPGAPGCPDGGGGMAWSRAGVVYHPDLDRVFMTFGNDGGKGYNAANFNWSGTVVSMRMDGTTDKGVPLDDYSSKTSSGECFPNAMGLVPTLPGCKYKYLGLLPGKSPGLRFIDMENLSGQGGPGHQANDIGPRRNVPQGGLIYAHPVIWTNPDDKSVWAFVGSEEGLCGLQLGVDPDGMPNMTFKWTHKTSFTTTPVIANGVLYATDGGGQARFWAGDDHGIHKIYALNPTTGAELWSAPIDFHHWSGPMVANGVVYIEDGRTGESGASQDNAGTISAFSLTADHPLSTLGAVGVSGLQLHIHAGRIVLALPLPAPAEISLLSLDGKALLRRHLEGASPFELQVPTGTKGALILKVMQGQREYTRRIHLD